MRVRPRPERPIPTAQANGLRIGGDRDFPTRSGAFIRGMTRGNVAGMNPNERPFQGRESPPSRFPRPLAGGLTEPVLQTGKPVSWSLESGGTPRVFDGRGKVFEALEPRPSQSLWACHPRAFPCACCGESLRPFSLRPLRRCGTNSLRRFLSDVGSIPHKKRREEKQGTDVPRSPGGGRSFVPRLCQGRQRG